MSSPRGGGHHPPPPPPPSPGAYAANKMPPNNNSINNYDNSSLKPRPALRRKSSSHSAAATASGDYLADAEAIVQNSPISPRQIVGSNNSNNSSTANCYSPKSPRRMPPPSPLNEHLRMAPLLIYRHLDTLPPKVHDRLRHRH